MEKEIERSSMQQNEQLRKQLRKTLSTYARGVSIHDVLGELNRLSGELTEIALQATDTGAAVDDYTIDLHGVVRDAEK